MRSFLLLAVFCPLQFVYSQSDCPQGYIQWRDEKCYYLHANFLSYEAAKQLCASEKSLLATIKGEAQQAFLDNFIHNVSGIENEVWIGAARVNKTDFQWEDGTPLDYANWAPGSPSEIDGRDCVVMQSRMSKLEEVEGRWRDVLCTRPNLFVCESEPTWSAEEVRKVLVETRKKLDNLLQEHETLVEHHEDLVVKHEDLDARHQTLVGNPVPIGFVYTQLPGQPEPASIWPNISWREISSQFAGKFFRVVGGASAAFGTTQDADSPRLTQVKFKDTETPRERGSINIVAGSWSQNLVSGGYDGIWVSTSFLVSNPEIRPLNTAVRIWIRES